MNRFKGNWSYKTSGTAVLQPVLPEEGTEEEPKEDMVVTLQTETGQMNILVDDKRFDSMKVTMNALGGDVIQMNAFAQDNELTIKPFVRRVVFRGKGNIGIDADVTVSGKAVRYDNVIIFDLQYEGECTHLGDSYSIRESHVSCVAQLNDF